ncbi:MAG: M1 family metallopeptidase [Acidobacteriota bacterium]
MSHGTLVPVLAGDRLVGVFFHGRGRFDLAAPAAPADAVFRTNVKRASTYSPNASGGIGDGIESALIMASSGLEGLAGERPWLTGAIPPGFEEWFARHLERFRDDWTPRWMDLMPRAFVDPPAEPLVIIEIAASKHDLAFRRDAMRDHVETLAVMNRRRTWIDVPQLKNRRVADELATVPVGRTWLEPIPKRFMLRAVDLSLVNARELRAELTVRETFQALQPLAVLDLVLWSSRLGTVGAHAGFAEHPYTVERVSLADGQSLPFHHAHDALTVQLPRVLAAGEEVTVEFVITGDVLFRPGNDNYWELPTGSWFPRPAHLNMEFATYHAVVKTSKPFVAFSCGATVRRWDEGDLSCAEFRSERPLQFPVVLAGKYTTYGETRGGVTVRASSYGMANKAGATKLINIAFTLIEFYRPFLGEYPFPELDIIEINSYGYGQAPAGIVFLTKEAFQPLQDETSRLFSQGINARVAHEMAHAWWGHVVKMPSEEDQWISESLAEYFAAFAIGRLRREADFKKALADWRGSARFARGKGSVFLANRLSGEMSWEDRYGLLYAQGPLVLHALRLEIGDNASFTVTKSLLKNFEWRFGETRHFIGLTNFITKKDYTDWFDRYLFGTESPEG